MHVKLSSVKPFVSILELANGFCLCHIHSVSLCPTNHRLKTIHHYHRMKNERERDTEVREGVYYFWPCERNIGLWSFSFRFSVPIIRGHKYSIHTEIVCRQSVNNSHNWNHICFICMWRVGLGPFALFGPVVDWSRSSIHGLESDNEIWWHQVWCFSFR